jgi:hypothetical protein
MIFFINDINSISFIVYKVEDKMENNIIVELDKIPAFLRNSKLYEILLDLENNEPFPMPEKYFKNNLIINNYDDFVHLLNTLRYWCINEIHFDVYHKIIGKIKLLRKFMNKIIIEFYDFSFIDEIYVIVHFYDIKTCNIKLIQKAVQINSLNILKYLDNVDKYGYDGTILNILLFSSEYRNNSIFKYFYIDDKYNFLKSWFYSYATKSKNTELMEYLVTE